MTEPTDDTSTDPGSQVIQSVLAGAGFEAEASAYLAAEIRMGFWLAGLHVVPQAESERAAGIASGQDLPGVEGAMLRFLKRLDLEQVRGWVNEELLRGTGPSDRFQVAVSASAFILAQAILSVKERGLATSDVLAAVPGAVHERIQEAVDARRPRVVGGTEG